MAKVKLFKKFTGFSRWNKGLFFRVTEHIPRVGPHSVANVAFLPKAMRRRERISCAKCEASAPLGLSRHSGSGAAGHTASSERYKFKHQPVDSSRPGVREARESSDFICIGPLVSSGMQHRI